MVEGSSSHFDNNKVELERLLQASTAAHWLAKLNVVIVIALAILQYVMLIYAICEIAR